MNALGTQLLLELRACNPELLDDLPYIRDVMVSSAQQAGATIVGKAFHKFSPWGVTGVVAISESHFSIHTWPEFQYAAVDIFTCGTTVDPHRAAALIIERLGCQDPAITELKRGIIPQPVKNPVG